VELTPEQLEKFRQTGIRLDREGRFWHEGEEITHAGFRRALLRWLDRLEDGRPILRLDERRYAYVDVEDTELLARSARWDGDRVMLGLNDGTEEELAYDTLRVRDDNSLLCAVRGGRLTARLTTTAYQVVSRGIVEVPGGGFALDAAGAQHLIAPAGR
jgi:hypothetical protein